MMAMAWSLGIRPNWMGKAALFKPPLGRIYRALGGIPTYGDVRTGVVEQSVARFRESDDLVLAVPAEGTRGLATHWRSGFYHIARLAEVPIVLGYLDYARKRAGLGPEIRPSGDVRADMDRIRAFYAGRSGRYPALFTEPRLIEEETAPAARQPPEAASEAPSD
jgi:1-acyl-sn-glycerol-3-phosphate acyltransferase